ncbi:MBL fold metallo-hydrolase [Candidatus Enterococcus ferrettii]|uniref:Metallo-beta-lactamase domain-containing protein n=1 Tax=Candidatus Enterococcus ferrettii TaxID=2815324 RepID=A0ABV0ELN2_9ENTE|nr:MBL fold metallo-hydrolase [Enterococcus sp. 665A]MBO1341857.1 MBL fold metallo-hydrolase [Enterococcus sp. 665A]
MLNIRSFGSGSSGNAYLIDDGNSQLLIEAGIQFRKVQQEMRFDFSRVAGCLISHEHRDHCKYVPQFVDMTAIDFYSTQGTFKGMSADPVLHLEANDYYRFNFLKYKETTKIGTWYVTSFETKHDAEEPCGFLIDNTAGDRLVFITDSYYVKYKFPNITHLMIEANYSKEVIDEKMTEGFDLKRKTRLLESHFDFEQTASFIKANKSDRLHEVWLLHLSDSNSIEKKFKEDTQRLTGVPVYIA